MSRRLWFAWGIAVAVALGGLTVPTPAPAQAPTGNLARDRKFEEFVRRTAGSMVADVAVQTEHAMKVKVRDSVSPEDVLPLTKSLVAGAQKDFPDEFISVEVYDPSGKAILKARSRPGKDVEYEVVPSQVGEVARPGRPEADRTPVATRPGPAEPAGGDRPNPSRVGRTEKDVKFARWAEGKGHEFLRYVEADLEENGRLWFGVTKAVEPKDVPALTKSLLRGAQDVFPRKELTATVFDPAGEKIGTASLSPDGSVRWAR